MLALAQSRADASAPSTCSQYDGGYRGGPRGRFGQSTRLYRSIESRSTSTLPQQANCSIDDARRLPLGDCSEPTSLHRLPGRGWVVVPSLVGAEEREWLVQRAGMPERMCSHKQPGCLVSIGELEAHAPGLVQRVRGLLEEWERTRVSADAELGSGLRLSRGIAAPAAGLIQ